MEFGDINVEIIEKSNKEESEKASLENGDSLENGNVQYDLKEENDQQEGQFATDAQDLVKPEVDEDDDDLVGTEKTEEAEGTNDDQDDKRPETPTESATQDLDEDRPEAAVQDDVAREELADEEDVEDKVDTGSREAVVEDESPESDLTEDARAGDQGEDVQLEDEAEGQAGVDVGEQVQQSQDEVNDAEAEDLQEESQEPSQVAREDDDDGSEDSAIAEDIRKEVDQEEHKTTEDLNGETQEVLEEDQEAAEKEEDNLLENVENLQDNEPESNGISPDVDVVCNDEVKTPMELEQEEKPDREEPADHKHKVHGDDSWVHGDEHAHETHTERNPHEEPEPNYVKKMLSQMNSPKEESSQSPDSSSVQNAAAKFGSTPAKKEKAMFRTVQLEKCSACEKTVYAMEKLEMNGHVYHKQCFKCSHCSARLTPKNFSMNEGVIYCVNHFKQLFARKGNYDEGFGRQQYKKKWQETKKEGEGATA